VGKIFGVGIEVFRHPTTKGKLEACGVLFSLNKKKELRYSFSDKVERKFEIVKRADRYEYRIKESLNPFKSYKILVKGYKNFEYTPQLSCKYRAKKRPKEILSLYDPNNFLHLIPNAPSRESRNIVLEEGEGNSSKKGVTQIPKELIPIYGDGVRFGLLLNGVKMDELTIDKDFSLKVANIFTKKIQPLINNKKLQTRLKKEGEIIEGATVVRNSGTGATYSAPINRKIIEAWINTFVKSKEKIME
jgi:hypothetical protein